MPDTPTTQRLKDRGEAILRQVEHHILDLPSTDIVDPESGLVKQFGKVTLALYTVATKVREGNGLYTSIALAESLFDIPAGTVKDHWYRATADGGVVGQHQVVSQAGEAEKEQSA